MSNEFYTILTNAGLAAIANASVSESTVNFAKVAVGDGNGAYYTPTREMTALRNQKWIGPVASVQVDENNPNWINVEAVIPATDGGFFIREIGIFNEADVLLAIGKLPETYKPEMESGSTKDLYLKAIFEVTNATVISLKADPSVVLASKKYVDDKVSVISGNLTQLEQRVTQHLDQYEYQTTVVSGTQIQLEKQSNSNRLLFKLESELTGNITVSTDGGETSKNLVDVDGVQITSLDKGFHEIVAAANFFILRNKGGLSKADLEALITITNEAEANESVLRTNYVNAVNAADESINLPSGATWNDILLQIPNIRSTLKNFYVGKITIGNETASFTYSNGTSSGSFAIVEFELGFKASTIILRAVNGGWMRETTYTDKILFNGFPAATLTSFSEANSNQTNHSLRIPDDSGFISETGFKLPVAQSMTTYTIIAYS